jgi:RimJ/RimL family protein N-acetyltransferase
MENIHFKLALTNHQSLIHNWLNNCYGKDTSHLDYLQKNFKNYLIGKKELLDYWVGYIDNTPFCLIITSDADEGPATLYQSYLSPHGKSWIVDFFICDPNYIGKGLGAEILKAFSKFAKSCEPKLCQLFIDPGANNSKTIYVCEMAGFHKLSEFSMEEDYFISNKSYLMLKELA